MWMAELIFEVDISTNRIVHEQDLHFMSTLTCRGRCYTGKPIVDEEVKMDRLFRSFLQHVYTFLRRREDFDESETIAFSGVYKKSETQRECVLVTLLFCSGFAVIT
ncbi:hypothetical protein Tcan_07591 [Toxocara canis]|uniref:Uncharacterized protein n=1 Tax=Toxocara canis TaxID=6265 RepID=A0A0B2VER6_TOXCA|nr:hypothetical protein Tcan_07591 [Toxocara canis]